MTNSVSWEILSVLDFRPRFGFTYTLVECRSGLSGLTLGPRVEVWVEFGMRSIGFADVVIGCVRLVL